MSFSPAWVVFIVLGLGLALWMTSIQWQARGGHRGDMWAIAVIGVPAGIIGGRIGHVLSASDTYFGPDGHPLDVFALWDGGFSFWGATTIGFLAVWLLTRFQGIRILPLLDSVAPGLLFGHVAGAFSDWFAGRTALSVVLAESIWNLLACVVLIVVAKRLRMGYGQVFALYLCLFSLGRVLLEGLRQGTAEAEAARVLLGLPVNVWTAVLALVIGLVWLIVSRLRHRTHETGVYTHGSRTLARRHRRGKHTYEVNTANITAVAQPPAEARSSAAPLPSVARIPDPTDAVEAGPSESVRGPATGSAPADYGNAIDADAVDGDADESEAVRQLAGRHSFGFFGAVTSAISIVPDVRGTTTPNVRDDDPRLSER